jgi:hypothetical protein
MLRIALAAVLATTPAAGSQPIPVHGETPGHTCSTTRTDRYLGRQGTRATGAAIKRASNAAVLRWAPPHTVLTMDYRADRVTVFVSARHRITKISCG